jgi:hypothetical protein
LRYSTNPPVFVQYAARLFSTLLASAFVAFEFELCAVELSGNDNPQSSKAAIIPTAARILNRMIPPAFNFGSVSFASGSLPRRAPSSGQDTRHGQAM